MKDRGSYTVGASLCRLIGVSGSERVRCYGSVSHGRWRVQMGEARRAFIALFAVGFTAIGCGATLAFDAGTAVAIDKAADGFVVLAGDSAHTGKPPRQTDSAATPLLDRVLDTSEIQHGVSSSNDRRNNEQPKL